MDNTNANRNNAYISPNDVERVRNTCRKLSRIRLIFFVVIGVLVALSIVIEVLASINLHFWSVIINPIVFWVFVAIESPFLVANIVFSIIIHTKRKKYGLYVSRKEMNYGSLESLEIVDRICSETDELLVGKRKRRRRVPLFVGFIIVAALLVFCIVLAYVILMNVGKEGLVGSAALTNGLKTLGGTMVGGVIVVGLIIAVPPILAGCIFFSIRELRYRVEKDYLYKEALRKHSAVIKALQEERNADLDRINQLNELNILLRRIIREFESDSGKNGKPIS